MKKKTSSNLDHLKKILDDAPNIYESCVAIGKTANKILLERQESFYTELDSIGAVRSDEMMTPGHDNWREALYEKYEKKEKR